LVVVPFKRHHYQLVEKGAEAASEAQDNVLLSAVLPKASGAGCAMNRFFNKLLDHLLPPMLHERQERILPGPGRGIGRCLTYGSGEWRGIGKSTWQDGVYLSKPSLMEEVIMTRLALAA
jgi:hypothetical protein